MKDFKEYYLKNKEKIFSLSAILVGLFLLFGLIYMFTPKKPGSVNYSGSAGLPN